MSPTIAPAVARLDALFKAFADPTRLRILNVLAAGELCVCDIVDLLSLPQPKISRHLATLRHAGLVEVVRAHQFAHYRLSKSRHPVHRTLLACVGSCFKGFESLDEERAAAESRVTTREAHPC